MTTPYEAGRIAGMDHDTATTYAEAVAEHERRTSRITIPREWIFQTAVTAANKLYPDDKEAASQYIRDFIGDAFDARFCPTCGADIIGNDPHEPGCETGGEA